MDNEELHKQLKRLQAENERLKETTDNLLQVQYALADNCNKYSKAFEEIRGIIDSRFKTAYMTLGFKEYDELIEDIDKIANEVLK